MIIGGWEASVLCKKCLFILYVLVIAAVAEAGPVKEDEATSLEQWRHWVGKRINITYACCGESACVQIRGAMLKEVAEKHIVIITKGSQLLLPVYMIRDVTLSK